MTEPFPQFRTTVIRPALKELDLWSPAAENLVYGTALTESGLAALVQRGGGPARGLWQVEEATYQSVMKYLSRKLDLMDRVRSMTIQWPPPFEEVTYNLKFGCAICRIHYVRFPKPLPEAHDIQGLAEYWKERYNTHLGKGTVGDFMKRAERILEGT